MMLSLKHARSLRIQLVLHGQDLQFEKCLGRGYFGEACAVSKA